MNWNFLFSRKSVHEQVTIFDQTLLNIFSNYVPSKLITVDNKDPPWMHESIKKKIKPKSMHVNLLMPIRRITMPT